MGDGTRGTFPHLSSILLQTQLLLLLLPLLSLHAAAQTFSDVASGRSFAPSFPSGALGQQQQNSNPIAQGRAIVAPLSSSSAQSFPNGVTLRQQHQQNSSPNQQGVASLLQKVKPLLQMIKPSRQGILGELNE
ncbi:unnamed protein product, partial [Meganyctiphanes norvegica]